MKGENTMVQEIVSGIILASYTSMYVAGLAAVMTPTIISAIKEAREKNDAENKNIENKGIEKTKTVYSPQNDIILRDQNILKTDKETTIIPRKDKHSREYDNLKQIQMERADALKDEVFKGCKNLESVSIAGGTTMIGTSVFENCSALKNVDLSPDTIYIGRHAFKDCKELTSFTFPENIKYLDKTAFEGCSNIAEIDISPRLLSKIDIDEVFKDTDLDKIMMHKLADEYKEKHPEEITHPVEITSEMTYPRLLVPESERNTQEAVKIGTMKELNITSDSRRIIGQKEFAYSPDLETVTMDNSVTNVQHMAFYACPKLKSVELSNNIKNFESEVFAYCGSLKEIKMPENARIVRYCMFNKCSSLENVELSPKTKEIEAYAFNGCKALKEINLPNNVKKIGQYAFYGCKNLQSIDIPDSVARLDNGAFAGCTNLTEVTISPRLLANINIDSVFMNTGIDMDKLHEIADDYIKDHAGQDIADNTADRDTDDIDNL